MRRILLLLLTSAAALVVSPSASQGAVFSRDWKTPGDGLLTYDDVNQREWLDLSQTILSSQFPGATRDERYDYVVAETAAGGAFAGFNVAKAADVIALAQSAGIDTSTQNYANNYSATYDLGDLVSLTIPPNPNGNANRHSVGLLDETGPPPFDRRVGALVRISFTNQAGLLITDNNDLLFLPPPGVFLIRTVPEPSGLYDAVIAIALLQARKKAIGLVTFRSLPFGLEPTGVDDAEMDSSMRV
jgi:hypothetical protein